MKYLSLFILSIVSREAIDLVFAIEGSEAIKNDFDNLKKTVIKMLDRYKISREDTHVGVLEFSDSTSTEIRLDAIHDTKILKRIISEIRPSEGEKVNIDKALEEAGKMFTVKYGGRPGYPKILVLITGSKSDGEKTLKEAVRPLKEEGIHLIVITVGNNTDPELPKITPNVERVDDSENLPNKTDDLVDKINKKVEKRKSIISAYKRNELILQCLVFFLLFFLPLFRTRTKEERIS